MAGDVAEQCMSRNRSLMNQWCGIDSKMRWTILPAAARLLVMDHGSVSTLVLHRVDAARNMARFYAMSIEPTLFGGRSRAGWVRRVGTRSSCSRTERRPRAPWRVWPGSNPPEAILKCLTVDGLGDVSRFCLCGSRTKRTEVPQSAQSWIKR